MHSTESLKNLSTDELMAALDSAQVTINSISLGFKRGSLAAAEAHFTNVKAEADRRLAVEAETL